VVIFFNQKKKKKNPPQQTLSTLKIATKQQSVAADAIKVTALTAGVSLDANVVSVTEVVKLSPFNIMPVLQTAYGTSVAGLSAIKYVDAACSGLSGRCAFAKAQIDTYLQIVPIIVDQVEAFKQLEASKSTDNDKINALNKLVAFVKPINETLVANTYLLGNTITIADIAVSVALKEAFALYFGPKKRTELAALTRWFNTMLAQKAAVKTFGAEIAIQAKDVHLMPDLTNLASAKPVVDKEDPIAKMARSPMHLDNIKKLYCQARPFNPEFGVEFWPQFDAEGWECFEVIFKYPEDYPVEKKLFMAENGINGFINRGESAKRNVFIVLNMFEKDGHFHIHGAGIIRGNREINGGKEIPVPLAAVADAEEYNFNYIDVSNDEGKAKFISAFCAADVNGAEILNRIHLK
jgi:glutathione S-transferase